MRLPAEWEPQEYVLMTFPHPDADWGDRLTTVSRAMVEAANLINEVTPVLMVVPDRAFFQRFAVDYQGASIDLPTDDCWIRDYGPITTLREGRGIANDFTFNGWGGKYPAETDNAVTQRLIPRHLPRLDYQKIAFELEGGAIDADGAGTILTTERCLLNTNRNGGVADKQYIEDKLLNSLGIKRIHWLTHGYLAGDDTDGHVDTLARFINPATIAYVRCDDPTDEHFGELQLMEAELRALRTEGGSPYRLLPLPWCPPIYADDGHRLPAGYANFLVSNGVIFLPTYYDVRPAGHPGRVSDRAARRLLETATDYRVVAVPCAPFLEQHGSLHCLTMQVPRPPIGHP